LALGDLVNSILDEIVFEFDSCIAEKHACNFHACAVHEFDVEYLGVFLSLFAHKFVVFQFDYSTDYGPSVHANI
jgi:hypothetical protein